MFLDHEYIGKIENGAIKVELYETGKRTWTLKKIYAYQIFDNNNLITENESFIPSRSDLPLIDIAIQEARISLPEAAPLAIEYIECFEVIQ